MNFVECCYSPTFCVHMCFCRLTNYFSNIKWTWALTICTAYIIRTNDATSPIRVSLHSFIYHLGLYEGSIVSCKLVEDLPTLKTVYVTAMNEKDWEILVCTVYKCYWFAITNKMVLSIWRKHLVIEYKTLCWTKRVLLTRT